MPWTRRRALLACATLAITSLAPVARAQDEPKGDLKLMQGEWVSKDESGESTWKFEGKKLSLKTPTRAYEIEVTLDEAAKPAKGMDMKVLDDSPNAKGSTSLAIYKFDGEKLTICFTGPGNPRPTEFKTAFPDSFSFELTKSKK